MWHYAERPCEGPLILFPSAPLTASLSTESPVALHSRFQFNPAAHEILATHVLERLATVVQTGAGDG
jgi:hypothetical protein